MMYKKIISSLFILLIIFLGLYNFSYGQNIEQPRLSRNVFIDVYTPDNLIVGFSYKANQGIGEYKPKNKTKFGYNNQIIIPKVNLNETDTTWKFYIKVNVNGKLNYLEVNIPFNSVEELNQKNQILLYVGSQIPSEDEIKYKNLINKNVDGIYVVSNENIVVQNKTFTDVSTTVIFPNILGVRTYRSVLVLCIIVFMLASGYLVFKKEVIKL